MDLCEGKILRAVGPPVQGMGLGVGSPGLGSPGKGPLPPRCQLPGSFHILGAETSRCHPPRGNVPGRDVAGHCICLVVSRSSRVCVLGIPLPASLQHPAMI